MTLSDRTELQKEKRASYAKQNISAQLPFCKSAQGPSKSLAGSPRDLLKILTNESPASHNAHIMNSLDTGNNLNSCPLTRLFIYIYIYDLMPKGAQMGGGFLTVNKICFKRFVLLLLYVCIHNWSVSQWKQYELQIWSSWRNIYFWKRHRIQPLKTDTLTVSAFDAFIHVHDKSKYYLSHQFV